MSYSVNEAAKLVGKNPRKIKLDIRQGKLEASRLGDKPNSAYRIEYKDLRKTYSTSFETQPAGDSEQMTSLANDAAHGATEGAPNLAAPVGMSTVLQGDTASESRHGGAVVIEDEPQILRAALAREQRNNRIIQKQLTDAVKRIERLLSGQVARGNSGLPPLSLEPHMRPSNMAHPSLSDSGDTAVATAVETPPAATLTVFEGEQPVSEPTQVASQETLVDTSPPGDETAPAPVVDHVPVLSSVLAEDNHAEADMAPKKHKEVDAKPPVIEASAMSHDEEETVEEEEDDEIPVNELIKNYQARLDASLDMIRNLRPD